MIGCPPAQGYAIFLRMLLPKYQTYDSNNKDILEVMVAVSESAELHDACIKDYETKSHDRGEFAFYVFLESDDGILFFNMSRICRS